MRIFDWLRHKIHHNNYQKNGEAEALVFINETPQMREAFRNIRATLSVSLPKNEGKGASILCAASYPNEGKTTTAVNLAVSFGKNVVLVDADIRKGSSSKRLGLDDKLGLCDVVLGKATLDEALVYREDLGCHVLPCGIKTDRPYDLLSSSEMQNLMEELKNRFDYVVYDTPPLRLVSDAYAIASLVDGVALVCKHRVSREEDIRKSLASLRYFRANVLGIITSNHKETHHKKHG